MNRVLAALLCVGFFSAANADESPQADATESTSARPVSFWMEKKLDYSQQILRGLAAGDFESIGQNAEQMRLLNKVEGFVRRRNPEYTAHLNTFTRVSNELVKQAEQENIEGATLKFNQLTISCVSCHQTIRQDEDANQTKPRKQVKVENED